MADQQATLRELYRGLFARPRPEDVAAHLLRLPVIERDALLEGRLHTAARATFSLMWDEFHAVRSPSFTVKVAHDLFADYILANPSDDCIGVDERDPARLAGFLAYLTRGMRKQIGNNDFLSDRLNRAARATAGLKLGNHAYNKRFRLLMRFEDKIARYEREVALAQSQQIGKAGLIAGITWEQFAASPLTAAFVAYYVARKARRSVFTNGPQSRPFDEVSQALLDKALADPSCDHSLIARVYPEPEVVARMDDASKGRLLGMWATELGKLTIELERLWRDGGIDLDTMIVARGNDSSRWNITAQAWNNARTAWMAMLAATGQQEVLEALLPGKVMRLIAADVARWHRASGQELHPDTKVWAMLPRPWHVLRGEETCTRADVEAACAKAGIDPIRSGWVSAVVNNHAVKTGFTPELVHGIEVSSPFLAALLRKAGAFSGKEQSSPPDVLKAPADVVAYSGPAAPLRGS